MRCSKYNKKTLNSYIDGELKGAEERALLRHLENCRECETFISDIKKAARLLNEASTGSVPAPESLWLKINSRLAREEKKHSPLFTWKRAWLPLAAAAAVLIVIFVSPKSEVSGFNAEEYLNRQMDYVYGDFPIAEESTFADDGIEDAFGPVFTEEL